jgi:ATP-dependent Clp protease ATP-binding subunit ClpA
MTEKGRFKKVVRARMARTGEPYTVARARLLGRPRSQTGNPSQGAPMYPFERFTEKAKNVLTAAQDEATRAGHAYIGTEHVLAALLRVEDGVAARVLHGFGVTLPDARAAIARLLGEKEPVQIAKIIPTSRVKKVIDIAFQEARDMGHNYVGTEHLLLGLLIDGQGIAGHVLQEMGVGLEQTREAIAKHLQENPAATGERPIPVDDEVRSVLERARTIAREQGAEVVGLPHLREALG